MNTHKVMQIKSTVYEYTKIRENATDKSTKQKAHESARIKRQKIAQRKRSVPA